MRIPRLGTSVAIIAIAFFLSIPAKAQVVRTWVSTAGVDNPSCSRSSPCRTFGPAIAAVDAGGEVVVLDSGGYGAFSVTKAVTILAPAGIHAAVAPTSGAAISINAPVTAEVRLVNLQLTGRGAYTGIEFTSGKGLSIEGCTIAGFSNGVMALKARTRIVRSQLLSNPGYGVYALGLGSISTVVVADSHFEGNGTGLFADDYTRAVISDSVVTSNAVGLAVRGTFSGSAELAVVRSTISMNSDKGLYIDGSGAAMTQSALLLLSDNEITANSIGVYFNVPSVQVAVLTRGNNTIARNGIDVWNGTLSTFASR